MYYLNRSACDLNSIKCYATIILTFFKFSRLLSLFLFREHYDFITWGHSAPWPCVILTSAITGNSKCQWSITYCKNNGAGEGWHSFLLVETSCDVQMLNIILISVEKRNCWAETKADWEKSSLFSPQFINIYTMYGINRINTVSTYLLLAMTPKFWHSSKLRGNKLLSS